MEKKTPQKIIFVINPISGGIDKERIGEQIRDFFQAPEYNLQIIFTEKSGNEEMIGKIIDKEQPDIMAVAGGDGTVNMVAGKLIDTDIPLGIIPAGSANGLATELGISKNIPGALKLISKGRLRQIDGIRIGDKYSFHLSDFGLNADVVKRFEEENIRGHLGYAKHFFKELFSIKGSRYTVFSNDNKIRPKATMLIIANATKFGSGAVINPEGEIDDGYFEIIIVKSYKSRKLLAKVYKFLRGKVDHREFVDKIKTDKARIVNHKKKTLQIDGELAGRPEEIEAEIRKACIGIIC